MDAMYYQKKRKQEKEEYYKKYPHRKEVYFDDFTIGAFIAVGVFTILFIGLLVITSLQEDKALNECEEIGGKYEVVDRQSTGKAIVNIYGCVK